MASRKLELTLSTTTSMGSCTNASTCNAVGNSVTVIPKGGLGPYTYNWEYVSGSVAILVDSDASATTTFSADVACVNGGLGQESGDWRCQVTDRLGQVVYTGNVTVTLNNNETTCA